MLNDQVRFKEIETLNLRGHFTSVALKTEKLGVAIWEAISFLFYAPKVRYLLQNFD